MNRRTFLAFSFFAARAWAAEPTWDELVHSGNEYMRVQREKLETEYGLSKYDRWDLDQETGELVFSNGGVPAIIAKFQFVGSVSETTQTWLWSWANASILPRLSQEVEAVREYGRKHSFSKLTERKWAADERDGWEMAAVTNYLLKANGVYRAPFKQASTFLVLTELRKVKAK